MQFKPAMWQKFKFKYLLKVEPQALCGVPTTAIALDWRNQSLHVDLGHTIPPTKIWLRMVIYWTVY